MVYMVSLLNLFGAGKRFRSGGIVFLAAFLMVIFRTWCRHAFGFAHL